MGKLKFNQDSWNNYFNYLLDLDDESKKILITKLTESLGKEKRAEKSFFKLFGSWEDTRSTDEIILNLKNSRVDKNDSAGFE